MIEIKLKGRRENKLKLEQWVVCAKCEKEIFFDYVYWRKTVLTSFIPGVTVGAAIKMT